MLHLSASQRYFLFQGDADMRKGFDSLSGIVGLTKKVCEGFENRLNDLLSPSPTREGVPFLVSPIVTNLMNQSVLNGDIFIFLNRKRNHVKLLHWEGDGFALYHKRLERGTYERPHGSDPLSLAVTHQQILLLLQGISLTSVKRRKRYQHPTVSCGY